MVKRRGVAQLLIRDWVASKALQSDESIPETKRPSSDTSFIAVEKRSLSLVTPVPRRSLTVPRRKFRSVEGPAVSHSKQSGPTLCRKHDKSHAAIYGVSDGSKKNINEKKAATVLRTTCRNSVLL